MAANPAPSIVQQIEALFDQFREYARTTPAINNPQSLLQYKDLSELTIARAVLYELRTTRRLTEHRVRDNVNFNFVEYVDNQPTMSPNEIFDNHIVNPHHLISLLRYAYNKDDNAILELIEQFLLTDIKSTLFNQYQLIHIAHRFNFPTLRKHCHSEFTNVEQMKEFISKPEFTLQLSWVDRDILDVRYFWLLVAEEEGVPLTDEFHAQDFHSTLTFEDSIATRYVNKEDEDEEDIFIEGFNNEITFDGFFFCEED